MKVLILGASGYTGKRIYENLISKYEVYGTFFSQNKSYMNDKHMHELNVSMYDDFKKLLDNINPQIIISCLRGNFNDQLMIHKIAAQYLKNIVNGKMIFISSVNVYDALCSSPHYEDDKTKSKSEYGNYKIECEKILMDELKNKVAILRVPFIWGKDSPRLTNVINEIMNKGTLSVWTNLYTNHTTDRQIINWINTIINKKMSGVYHVGSNKVIEYKKFIEELIDKLDIKTTKLIDSAAELKRMGNGVGKEILIYLENKARDSGYKKIILETRKCNVNAVNLYLYNKYKVIDNYGEYKDRKEAICFEKIL